MKPKIALIGYGSMGLEIEKIAKSRNFIITDIFELDNKIIKKKKYDFDVAIDFSFPDSVEYNVKTIAELKKNIVIGTTGWYDKLNLIKNIINEAGVGCVYASNFSIGMQMFFKIVKDAADLINQFPDYDIMLHEIHHKRKKDTPSGSALRIADIILENVDSKKTILKGNQKGGIKKEQLHISSARVGEVTGIHSVLIDSLTDSLEIIHRAKNRNGFANGALSAAEWIYGKKGFYKFDDIFGRDI
jgi:4-hydroxy-tetrahydrodipicolinate reductase